MPIARSDGGLAAWPLALIAGLLPALGALVAINLAVDLALIAACNPLIDGCVSVSRAARYDTPNYIFRACVAPAAALQGLSWLLCRNWLVSLGAVPRIRLRLLPWIGALAALALVVYVSFLGTEGAAYRWLRQYGTLMYFGCTYLALAITSGELLRLAPSVATLARWRIGPILVGLCVLMLLLGLGNLWVARSFDAATKDRVENITEWWLGVALTAAFCILALAWRCTRFGVRAQVAGNADTHL
jgi:hypothetical protein